MSSLQITDLSLWAAEPSTDQEIIQRVTDALRSNLDDHPVICLHEGDTVRSTDPFGNWFTVKNERGGLWVSAESINSKAKFDLQWIWSHYKIAK